MRKIFDFEDGKWYKGTVTFKYDLESLLKLLALIVVIPFILIYRLGRYLYNGAKWLGKKVWSGIKWLANKAWPILLAIAALLVAFWAWLKGLFNRPSKPQQEGKEKNHSWWWIILAILLLLLAFLAFRGCSNSKDDFADVPDVVYEEAFYDYVVVSRAYLDGVQEETSKECPRALVGFKFINDKSVKDYDFTGLTYEEAVQVVSDDWKPIVLDNLNPSVSLTKQQMAVVTLTAMRMGKNGFARSSFLRYVNEGNLEEAGKWLLLQDKDGNIRQTGSEPKQYFYMLRLLWNEEISVDELLYLPMFSYKGINVEEMYDANGNYIFNDTLRDKLEYGNFRTPAEALEL